MKRFFILIFFLSFVFASFAGVKPFVDAYFSTSLFQNVDDIYLREHYGPYKYGFQYGDNRWYLRDSRLSFIFGVNVKEENLFGSVDFYANSFLDGSTYLDINSGLVGYSDEEFTVKGFFKSRSVRMKLPSEVFFDFLPSLSLFSSSFSRGHWFVPYFLYPIEFIDGSVEIFSTTKEDVTNLVFGGRDYYGIYASYFNGLVDVEGYFAKNIYDSVGVLQNASLLNNMMTGNYGGIRLGGAGSVGFGDAYLGVLYRELTTNSLSPYSKGSDYRFYFLLPMTSSMGSSNNYIYTLPLIVDFNVSSYNFVGGYATFDMTDFLYVGLEGGMIFKKTYIGTNKYDYQDIYFTGGVLFKGIEGAKFEVSGVGVIPNSDSNISILGGDVKLFTYYEVPLITESDEVKTLFKLGLRDMKVEEPKYIVTSIVGIGNVGYVGGNFSLDVLGYANNSSFYSSIMSLSTNLFYSDVRVYFGYNLSSLFSKKVVKEIGNDLWLKLGGRGVVQVGNVNLGNVGENTILTPYVAIWYSIPKVNSYIILSYGWYGMTSINDLDIGRGLESTIIMYNGGRDFSSGLIMADNFASTLYSDGRSINTGEYKLAVEPVIRFDVYIRY
ncbi:MAG: hypothetical protein ACK4F9_06500 [Brevinematia bacterium]